MFLINVGKGRILVFQVALGVPLAKMRVADAAMYVFMFRCALIVLWLLRSSTHRALL